VKLRITRRVALKQSYEFIELKDEKIDSMKEARRCIARFELLSRFAKNIENLQNPHLEGSLID